MVFYANNLLKFKLLLINSFKIISLFLDLKNLNLLFDNNFTVHPFKIALYIKNIFIN